MPRFRIRFNPAQTKLLLSLMEGLNARALDMAPPLLVISNLYLEQQRAIFEGAHNWAPLTPGTIASKERRGVTQMLVESGLMKRADTVRKASNKYALTTSTSTYALLGTWHPLAHLQAIGTAERVQRKTGRRTGRVTARPFGPPSISLVHIDAYYAILENYLVNGTVDEPVAEGIAAVPTVDLSAFDRGI